MKRLAAVGVLALVPFLAGGCGGSGRATTPTLGHRCTVTLRATAPSGQNVMPAGMKTAQRIVKTRLAKIGVSSPQVAVHGDELVIDFGSAPDPDLVSRISLDPGRLQMFDFEPSLASPSMTQNQHAAPLPSLYALLAPVQTQAGTSTPESYYLVRTKASHPVMQGPAATLRELLLPYKGKQPLHTQVLKVPANREAVSCKGAENCPHASSNRRSPDGRYWYLLRLPAARTGNDILESGVGATRDPNTGQPIVTLQFTPHGAKEFRRLTAAEYRRGRVNAGVAGELSPKGPDAASIISRYAGHNAIVLDGQLEETPYIDYTDPSLSRGIIGGAEVLEPNTQTARRTALVLQTGALPYSFRRVATSCS